MRALPRSLTDLLATFRPCFTAPTFRTFTALTAGMIAQPSRRTVCGMLTGAGLHQAWHHSRAHRFFSQARWDPDQVGLTLLRLIVGWLVSVDAPVLITIDDTLFRRTGRKIHAAAWCHDGAVKVPGNKPISWGNCWVVVGVLVDLPFLNRPICLPVLFRLWRRQGRTKTALARNLVELIAAHLPRRRIHVVADAAYIVTELRRLPPHVTLTGRLRANAAVYSLADPQPGKRGRPRLIGEKIGTPQQLAETSTTNTLTLHRCGRDTTATVVERICLWRGVFRTNPVRVIIVREPRRPDLALITTDLTSPTRQIIERYAARWAIEVAFAVAKDQMGVGEARNHTRYAVERTVPFGLIVQSIVTVWYHLAGHHPATVRARREHAPWYATKAVPSFTDMIVKLRRVLIAAQFRPEVPRQPSPEESLTIQLAWATAGI